MTDLELARATTLRPIGDVAADLGLSCEALEPYGHDKAKLRTEGLPAPSGKLVLVTAMTPTKAGEGKTTTSVALAQGLNRIGHRTCVALREPSLGPTFGMKGGATGGGRSQVLPMESINLHFTGDFHAVAAAHNLLAAMLDNHLHFGNQLGIDVRRPAWKRVLDVNDRALRQVVLGLGGRGQGVPRESGFDITAASEVMAILCLARDAADLQARLARIVVGQRGTTAITAADLEADGAMAVLLQDALKPNLVQTMEGTPALVHGGPFANIAHGANTVIATRASMALAHVTVTEAGFGSDLGAQKFFDLVCPAGGFSPDAVVLVATVRALKAHGGTQDLQGEDVAAVEAGLANLQGHVDVVGAYGREPVVALNHFVHDSHAEVDAVRAFCERQGLRFAVCRGWAEGGAGAEELAHAVADALRSPPPPHEPLVRAEDGVKAQVERLAARLYGASGVAWTADAERDLERLRRLGFAELPVCVAKTPASFSDDPSAVGRPKGFVLTVRGVELAAGAGYAVPLTGAMVRMPGLPRRPAAEGIRIGADGLAEGLS